MTASARGRVAVASGFPTRCPCRLGTQEPEAMGWLRCARFLHELKMLLVFPVHSKEANSAQDLAALAGLRQCSKDKTRDAVCGIGVQGKKLFAVRIEYKQAERH